MNLAHVVRERNETGHIKPPLRKAQKKHVTLAYGTGPRQTKIARISFAMSIPGRVKPKRAPSCHTKPVPTSG